MNDYMILFKNKYRIETTRLRDWDYRNAGYYFVTICTKNRIQALGGIEGVDLRLSAVGEIAAQCWLEIPDHHPGAALDEFVIMPNHVHGIIVLVETLHATSLQPHATSLIQQPPQTTPERMSAISPKTGSLGSVMRSYKSAVSRLARLAGHEFGWQERYWDHIVRDNQEFNRIRKYILQNPVKWKLDCENDLGLWM